MWPNNTHTSQEDHPAINLEYYIAHMLLLLHVFLKHHCNPIDTNNRQSDSML
jgi:hypothetical protein